MNADYEKLMKCYECVQQKISFRPELALILGSGLGDYADTMEVVETLDCHDIEGFPVSTVPGHKGRFVFGYAGGVPIVAMQGRVHFYEGYRPQDVVLPVRLMKLMGAKAVPDERRRRNQPQLQRRRPHADNRPHLHVRSLAAHR